MKFSIRQTLLFFCGVIFFQAGGMESNYSPIYCGKNGNMLFDQSELISTEAFQWADEATQQTMLEEHFHYKRALAYLYTITNSTYYALPLLPVVLALYHFKDRLNNIPPAIGLGGGAALGPLLGNLCMEPINNMVLFLQSLKQTLFGSTGKKGLDHFEIEYVRNKPHIPKSIQEALEHNFMNLRCYTYHSHQDTLLKAIEIALKLPFKSRKINYDSEHIDQVLAGYSPQTTLELKRYCVRHAAASTADSVRKIAAYFYGEPGVGKTRAAKLIAQALQLPFNVISLADMNIHKLIGDYEHPGLLLTILTKYSDAKKNVANMILLIDDTDRILLNPANSDLLSFLLTLLEPETSTFYSPYLKADVDISHMGIILAGKDPVTDEALHSRLHIIPFDKYEHDYKKVVVWNELFPEILHMHEQATLKLSEEDVTQADREMINKLIDQDADSGFRSIKLKLMTYLEDKVLKKYFHRDEQEPVAAA